MIKDSSAHPTGHETRAAEITSPSSRNRELLRHAELGAIMLDAYVTAVNCDHRLDEVEIVPLTDGTERFAFARPIWNSRNTEHAHHQIHIRLDDLDAALNRHKKTLDTIPGARELFAQLLEIEPAAVTPQLLHVFSFIHELGHTIEYMNYEHDPAGYRRIKNKESAALPIANTAISALLDRSSSAHQAVRSDWGNISRRLSVNSLDQLIDRQHQGYRNTTFERNADSFAMRVFAINPQLISQLTNTAGLDYYRKFPAVA